MWRCESKRLSAHQKLMVLSSDSLGTDAKVQYVLSYYVRALVLAVEAYVYWIELRSNAVIKLLLVD